MLVGWTLININNSNKLKSISYIYKYCHSIFDAWCYFKNSPRTNKLETGNCSIGLRPTSTAWIIEQIAVSFHILVRQIVNINRSSSECHQQKSSIYWRGNNAHLISCADLVFDTGAKIPRKVPRWWWGENPCKLKPIMTGYFMIIVQEYRLFAWHKLNLPIQ